MRDFALILSGFALGMGLFSLFYDWSLTHITKKWQEAMKANMHTAYRLGVDHGVQVALKSNPVESNDFEFYFGEDKRHA